jgi:hypothetical protein
MKTMKKSKKVTPNDEIIVEPEILPKGFNKLPSPLSCRPDETVMAAFAAGSPHAIAIVEAWRFNLPIVKMTRAEFAKLNHHTTFHG